MSAPSLTATEPILGLPTLEVIWQQDASACVLTRSAEGELSAGHLHVGMPSVADIEGVGRAVSARRASVGELIRLAEAPPAGLELGGTARATFAVLELAQGAVTEGLVHPQLEYDARRWFAFWAATLDDPIEKALAQIAAALPEVCAAAFDGDRDAAVHDLYPYAVDHIARARLRAAGVRLTSPSRRLRSAIELFLEGLTAPTPELPENSGYSVLERKLTKWVDDGLTQLNTSPWKVVLHLDERDDDGLALEVWLQAEDDATLSLPASLLWNGGDEVFAFMRASDPRRALIRGLAEHRAGAGRRRHRVRRARAGGGRARSRPGEVLPARRDPEARGARRAGAAAVGLAALVDQAAREPEGDDAARSDGALERPARDGGARVVRLAAGDRRQRAERGGAAGARHVEGSVRAGRRPLACGASGRTSRRRCASSSSGEAGTGSSSSCARCRGSRRRRRVSSSAR